MQEHDRTQFYESVSKSPSKRSTQDLDTILNHIRKLPLFQNYQIKDLKVFAASLRFKALSANELVFERGDDDDNWYFVYKGEVNVLIGDEKNEILCTVPEGEAFGKNLEGSNTQKTASVIAVTDTELLILESSVIEQSGKQMKRTTSQSLFDDVPDYVLEQVEKEKASTSSNGKLSIPVPQLKTRSRNSMPRDASSTSISDTNSEPPSPRPKSIPDGTGFSKNDGKEKQKEEEEEDANEEEEEEEEEEEMTEEQRKFMEEFAEGECLEAEFQDMDESDIKDFLLHDFRHLKAFSRLSSSMQAELSRVVTFQFTEKKGEYIFKQGDIGTSWYVIYKGSVDVVVNGEVVVSLGEGDGFGELALITDKPRAASIVTKEDGCQFIVVDKKDFVKIQQEINNNTIKLEEHGKVVLVLERKDVHTEVKEGETPTEPKKSYYAVMAGTSDRLVRRLLEDHENFYAENFLLTFRMFMSVNELWTCLNRQFESAKEKILNPDTEKIGRDVRDKVIWALDRWIRLHPLDFRSEGALLNSVVKFIDRLKMDKLLAYYDKIYSAMIYQRLDPSTKTRSRSVSIYQNTASSTWVEEEKVKKKSTLTRIMRNSFISRRKSESSKEEEPPLLKSYNQTSTLARVYRPSGNYKTFAAQPTDTAFEIIFKALEKFRIEDSAKNYELVEVRTNGTMRVFTDDEVSVLSGMSINGRLYLRNKNAQEHLEPPTFPIRPPHMQNMLLEMDVHEVARIMTLLDHESLNKIDPLEFMFHIFKIKGKPIANLNLFVNRFNEVNVWVETEILSKDNIYKRALVVKKFIDLASILIGHQNFNSGFAILSGLGNVAITRLSQTWKKISSNIMLEFENLQKLMDPSRNMKTYRTLLLTSKPPLIPFFPLIMKDLFFLNDCNENKTPEGLVNFEKFRMIAELVRMVDQYRRVPFDQLLQPKPPASRMDRKRMSIVSETFLERQFTKQEISEFLSSLYVIDDPKALSNLSYEIEPRVTS